MNNRDGMVLVTGATGRQGGSVVRHMLKQGWKLRALVRNPEAKAAKMLAEQGVEVVRGDLEDPTSLTNAVRGVMGVYSVDTGLDLGFELVTLQSLSFLFIFLLLQRVII